MENEVIEDVESDDAIETPQYVDRMLEIQDEMLTLLDEAERLIHFHAKSWTYDRAKSYWLAHVRMGLTNDHGYLGSSGVSMQNTIDEMDDSYSEDEE